MSERLSEFLGDAPLPYYARPDLATQEVIYPPDQVFGLQLDVTVPGEFIYRVLAVQYLISAGPVVVNRLAILEFFDTTPAGGRDVVSIANNAAIVAGSFTTCVFSEAITSPYGVQGILYTPLPRMILTPGFIIRLNAINLQLNDRISTAAITVVKIPTGPERGGNPLPIVLPMEIAA